MFDWWTQAIGANIEDSNNKIKEVITVDNKTHLCYSRTYEYVKGSYITMNIDQPSASLWAGGFVQGKSIKTGAEPLERIPVA